MSKLVFRVLVLTLVSTLAACSGGGSSSTPTPTTNKPPVISEGAAVTSNISINNTPTAFNLTLNASDPDNDTLTWSISKQGTIGTASLAGTTGTSMVENYTPNDIGTDTFDVTVDDGRGGTATTTVTVNISDATPVIKQASPTSRNMSINSYPTPFSLTLDATDANNDTLTWKISNAATNGTASVSSSGSAGSSTATVSYTPNANYIGTDTFNVQVSDGHAGGTAAITVNVTVATSNTTSVTVDAGPPVLTSANSYTYNRPYVSVKICDSSGNCQVIDHILLDTGSVGLRVLASAFDATKLDYTKLPPIPDTFGTSNTGLPVAECYQFIGSHMWGTLRSASVQIGGEVTTNPIPIQVVSDSTAGNIPTACANAGADWGQIGNLYANGILGVQFFNQDCGQACTTASNNVYFTCSTPSTCTAIDVPKANQVPNPVTQFAINSQGGHDTNGVKIQMPAVTSSTGDATSSGTLYFGVDTQSNNALGSAAILPVTSKG
ncbi:MAG: DUF3443 family protein, partial [Gammaproteobacteria bacterium]